MPIVLIIISLVAVLCAGVFFLRQEEVAPVASTVVPVVEVVDEIIEPQPVTPTPSPVTPTPPSVEKTPPKTAEAIPPAQKPVTPTETPREIPKIVTAYKNGTYTVETPYFAPSRARHIVTVSLTISDDVVTGAKVFYGGDIDNTSTWYQKAFSDAYKSEVVGKSLKNISLSRVGGASLTSNAFNDALVKVKLQAGT